MKRMPRLVVLVGGVPSQRYDIPDTGLLIGRDPDCQVILEGQGVSRHHAQVLVRNGSVWIQDAGSRNGVFVKGKRLMRPQSVDPGDEVVVGQTTFTVEPPPEEDQPLEPPKSPPSPAADAEAGSPMLIALVVLSLIVLAAVLFLRLR